MSCLVCHGIERATRDGNGSWTLRRRRIFLPDPDNEASVERHRDEARPLAGVDLCGSCHRGVLSEATGNPAALTGMDDLAGWGESRFAGTRLDRIDLGQGERKSCRDCHMPAEDGLASHRFPGGHTWLAALRGDLETLGRIQELLRGAADLDLAVDAGVLTVGVRNVGVGHRFPGGVRDAQDTRLEVEARDSAGVFVWRDDRHRLAAWVADADGHVVRDRATHRFRAPVADHTIPPGATRLARYRLPKAAASAMVRLVHRSRSIDLLRATCRVDDRGCAPQPTTVIAQREVPVLQRAPDRPAAFALGQLADLQERGGQVSAAGDGYVLGRQLARQGRVDAALAAWSKLAPHPALERARGRALVSVWRFDDAIPHLRAAASSAPESVSAWRELAVATAAAGRRPEGLDHGLDLSPSDADLLRVRALGTQSRADLARWQDYRGPDNAGAVAIACGQRSAACQQARQPIPELRAPGPVAMQPP